MQSISRTVWIDRIYLSSMAIAVLAVFLLLFVARKVYAAPSDETVFILNTFASLIWGALIMWMGAGFTMLEAGSVRTKNASMICLKNIGLYSIAALAFYFIGYNLMFVDVQMFIGRISILYGPASEDIALLVGDQSVAESVISRGYATMADLFFEMVFVATAASIVSGTLAERVNMWAFFLFILVLTAFIYPIVGAWTWGGGWLGAMGFHDFAGSTVVHGTGGWAALAGVLVVGPRLGKFRKDGSVRPTPPSNTLLVTLGVFILWLGWLGYTAGSQLNMGSATDVVAMSQAIINTMMAAASGVIAAILVSRPILGRIDLIAGLNGAIAGLVAITASPDLTEPYWAVLIGVIGAVICTGAIKILEKLKIDDVVGAIPAHLCAGIWGTLITGIVGYANFGVQLIGVLAVGVFTFIVSWLVWQLLDKTIGIRVSQQIEQLGQDAGELGIESYPEFVLMPEEDVDE